MHVLVDTPVDKSALATGKAVPSAGSPRRGPSGLRKTNQRTPTIATSPGGPTGQNRARRQKSEKGLDLSMRMSEIPLISM